MNAVLKNASLPAWQGGELRCIERIEETHDSTTFVLSSDVPSQFEFVPGQFLTIGVEVAGKKHYRAYSISSTPLETDTLSITVKRVDCGLVSNHLIDKLKAGDCLDALAPAGEFHLQADVTNKHILLSAGSGITPMMSIARWLLANDSIAEIHFIHSARNEKDIIFRDALLAMEKKHPNFKLDLFLSKPEGGIPCHTGRLTPERLTALLTDAAQSRIFLCGHESYMEMIENWHRSQALPTDRFHKESFSPAELPVADENGKVFELSVPAFGKTTTIVEGQSLLEVLETESLPIIGACRSGVCGSCKCKVTKGEVERLSTDTLTPEEIDSGVVLACSSLAKSALTVELL